MHFYREAVAEVAQRLMLGLLSISQESALSKGSANLHTPTLRKKHYKNTVLIVRPLIYDLWPARYVKHAALSLHLCLQADATQGSWAHNCFHCTVRPMGM